LPEAGERLSRELVVTGCRVSVMQHKKNSGEGGATGCTKCECYRPHTLTAEALKLYVKCILHYHKIWFIKMTSSG
jgi:hypothetical protein